MKIFLTRKGYIYILDKKHVLNNQSFVTLESKDSFENFGIEPDNYYDISEEEKEGYLSIRRERTSSFDVSVFVWTGRRKNYYYLRFCNRIMRQVFGGHLPNKIYFKKLKR